jgi:hypothetical protein
MLWFQEVKAYCHEVEDSHLARLSSMTFINLPRLFKTFPATLSGLGPGAFAVPWYLSLVSVPAALKRWAVCAEVALLLFCCAGSASADSQVSIAATGTGAFTISAVLAEKIAALEISIDYDAEKLSNPQLQKGVLAAIGKAVFTSSTGRAGVVSLSLAAEQGMRGAGLLAQLNFTSQGVEPGTIYSVQASLKDMNGYLLPVTVKISNPVSDVDRGPAFSEPVREVAPKSLGLPASASDGARMDPLAAAGVSAHQTERGQLSYRHQESALERFSRLPGTATLADLDVLFKGAVVPGMLQTPPVLLSDGVAKAALMLRTEGELSAGSFTVRGGQITAFRKGDQPGEWLVEVLPDKGGYAASLFVLTGTEIAEYPLTVAPVLPMLNFETAAEVLVRRLSCRHQGKDFRGGVDCPDSFTLLDDYILAANYFATLLSGNCHGELSVTRTRSSSCLYSPLPS